MVYLYTCAFSNCEMFSDAFPSSECFGGSVISVKSEMINIEAFKGDMGDADEVEDQDQRVNNVAHGFKYNESKFTKAQFGAWIKPYLKRVGERKWGDTPDAPEYAAFKKNCQEFAKFVLGRFADFEFYMNEENDMDGALALCYWEDPENDKGPTFLYLKDGMIKNKI